MTWVDNPFLRQLMDEINAVPPPGRAASSPMFRQPAAKPQVPQALDPSGASGIPGALRRPEVGTVTGGGGGFAPHRMSAEGQRMYNAAQQQGADIDPAEMVPHTDEVMEKYGKGEYEPTPDPLDLATDASTPEERDLNEGEHNAAETAKVLRHPVAQALLGPKKHSAVMQFLDMVHKPEQK